MNIPKSATGWIVSPMGEVRPASSEDVRMDDLSAEEGGPREIHATEEQVRATVRWCAVVKGCL